jgi:hypothetical protein
MTPSLHLLGRTSECSRESQPRKPAEKPPEEASREATRASREPSHEPAVKPAEKPSRQAEKPAERPAGRSQTGQAGKPRSQPRKPAETPAEKASRDASREASQAEDESNRTPPPPLVNLWNKIISAPRGVRRVPRTEGRRGRRDAEDGGTPRTEGRRAEDGGRSPLRKRRLLASELSLFLCVGVLVCWVALLFFCRDRAWGGNSTYH